MIHKIDKKNKKEKMCVESQHKNVLNKKTRRLKHNEHNEHTSKYTFIFKTVATTTVITLNDSNEKTMIYLSHQKEVNKIMFLKYPIIVPNTNQI